jgi:hypothetical protein
MRLLLELRGLLLDGKHGGLPRFPKASDCLFESTAFCECDAFVDEFFKAWRSFHPMSVRWGSRFEPPLPRAHRFG